MHMSNALDYKIKNPSRMQIPSKKAPRSNRIQVKIFFLKGMQNISPGLVACKIFEFSSAPKVFNPCAVCLIVLSLRGVRNPFLANYATMNYAYLKASFFGIIIPIMQST